MRFPPDVTLAYQLHDGRWLLQTAFNGWFVRTADVSRDIWKPLDYAEVIYDSESAP